MDVANCWNLSGNWRSSFFKFIWRRCIVTNFFVIKPTDALISQIYFCQENLHVSGSSSAHHQEFSTVYPTLVCVMQFWWQLSSIEVRAWKLIFFCERKYLFLVVHRYQLCLAYIKKKFLLFKVYCVEFTHRKFWPPPPIHDVTANHNQNLVLKGAFTNYSIF
jgi:hypothetical protein